jgi:hypothetical protein
MQKSLIILLIFLGIYAEAQKCPKYESAMNAGEKYLEQNKYDEAMMEFLAAQVASRECGFSTTDASNGIKKALQGLKDQYNELKASQEKILNAAEKMKEEEAIISNTFKYIFASESDSVAWMQDNLYTNKWGVIDRKGNILTNGFEWVNPKRPFSGMFSTAVRNDTMYIIGRSGKIISKPYENIMETEFPGYYYAAKPDNYDLYHGTDDLVSFSGDSIMTILPVRNFFSLYDPRVGILPYCQDQYFGFLNKYSQKITQPCYKEIRVPENLKLADKMIAARRDNLWEIMDLTTSTLLNSGLSYNDIQNNLHNIIVDSIFSEGKQINWVLVGSGENKEINEDFLLSDTLFPETTTENTPYSDLDTNYYSNFETDTSFNLFTGVTTDSVSYDQFKNLLDEYMSLWKKCDTAIKRDTASSLYLKEYFEETLKNIDTSFSFNQFTHSDSVSKLDYENIYRTYIYLQDLYDIFSWNDKPLGRYEESEIYYPGLGEDISSMPAPRFKIFEKYDLFGIIGPSNDTILPPRYTLVRYYSGDSIFIIGLQQDTISSKVYSLNDQYPSMIGQLFNASTGLFSSFASDMNSILEWWNCLFFAAKIEDNENIDNNFCVLYTKDGRVIPSIDMGSLDVNYDNDEERKYGIIKTEISKTNPNLAFEARIQNLRCRNGKAKYDKISSEGIFSSNDSYKECLIKADGTFLTPLIFTYIESPSEGKCVALLNDKYGYIDSTGWVIPFDFEFAASFSEGKACVRKDGKFGVIDSKGKSVIPFFYDQMNPGFHEGVIAAKKGNNWGLLNAQGKWVINAEYDTVSDCTNGIICAKKYGKWGYLDKSGNVVYPFILNQAEPPAKNGLSRVQQEKKWGFLNVKNGGIFPALYDTVMDFIGNFAWAKSDSGWMIIDTNGNIVYKGQEILDIWPYDDGMTKATSSIGNALLDSVGHPWISYGQVNSIRRIARGKYYCEKTNADTAIIIEKTDSGVIRHKTIKKYPGYRFSYLRMVNGLYFRRDTMVNWKGEFLFTGPYSVQQIAHRIFELDSSGMKGYAAFTDFGKGNDGSDKPIRLVRLLRPQFEEIGFPLDQEFMPVKKNGKWGFIRWIDLKDGTEIPDLIISCKYDAVVPFFKIKGENIAVVACRKKVFYINEKDQVLFSVNIR